MALTKNLNRSITETTKAAIKRVCILKPLQPDHQIIYLDVGKNIVGRNKNTGIRDQKCSKQQLELNVNLDDARVTLKVLGVNPSSINGLMVMPDVDCEIAHGDVLEIIYGRHPFEVVFKPPPKTENKMANNQKDEKIAAIDAESWDAVEDGKVVIYTSAGVRDSKKIAAYDMDGTIIKTKSGNVFPKNIDDWDIISQSVPSKLKRLYEEDFKICFFTNQHGIGKGKVDLNEFKGKIRKIVKRLDVPVQVFISIDSGYYRKPLPGMWEYLQKHKNSGIPIELEKSFYVGDAAGRPEAGSGVNKRRKDHSSVDRFFAANISLAFYTPENHFLGTKTEEWIKPEYDPKNLNYQMPLFEPTNTKIPSDSYEMIVMVGLPGSGKSHFVQKHLSSLNYTIANADTLGNIQACLKECERALKSGTSCIVDNTNVDVASRKKFIELAKKLSVPCRSFVMNTTLGQLKHNLIFRELTDPTHSKINDMVLNMMKKKYTPPTLEEGFSEIAKVNIKPNFQSKNDERLYKLYLVEK